MCAGRGRRTVSNAMKAQDRERLLAHHSYSRLSYWLYGSRARPVFSPPRSIFGGSEAQNHDYIFRGQGNGKWGEALSFSGTSNKR